jgi:primosomal protein N' (replication factor Y) (superfamily II helicase)
MSSAARSTDARTTPGVELDTTASEAALRARRAIGRDVPSRPLSGPVSVCIDRPVLSLDRPFTYELAEDVGAGAGSLVQVPFHGRRVRGWILGPTDDVPARMAGVTKAVSPVRFFDAQMLELYRWMGDRYLAPLASVIARSVPPRVASEEGSPGRLAPPQAGPRRRAVTDRPLHGPAGPPSPASPRNEPARLTTYRNGGPLLEALGDGGGTFVVRPGPADEAAVAVECVAAALDAGRTAIVLVPEAEPLPATAAAIREAFGDEVALFLGGDKRARYRMWLDIAAGRYRVVVGTRPAVFAPLSFLGLVVVHREGHALHREERSPYYHVRDVARERARIEGAVCLLAGFCPSLESTTFGHVDVESRGRPWAPVEVVKPGPEGRSPRLVRALANARGAFLYEPVPGYGLARVCRVCGDAAVCASCRGPIRVRSGEARCTVCEAPGRCASCGASDFGIARGGAERVHEWAQAVTRRRVVHARPGAASPDAEGVLVGGQEVLKDVGSPDLDLVGILSVDASLRRPGLSSRERAVNAWFEAAAWARPGGRVIVQTTSPNDPAIQALVMARPDRFHRSETARRADAGFPAGAPVFRIAGTDELESELEALPHRTLLSAAAEGSTVCLLALDPSDLPAFGRAVRALAGRGVVTRVEAEPHL